MPRKRHTPEQIVRLLGRRCDLRHAPGRAARMAQRASEGPGDRAEWLVRIVTGAVRVPMAVIAFAAMAGPALAQSWPSVPWPIADADIERYAQTLQLDDAQRLDLSGAHDAYVRAFHAPKELIESQEVAAHRAIEIYFDGTEPVAHDAFVEALRLAEELRAYIDSVDAAFMVDVERLLREEQREMMPLVRDCRTRQVLYSGMSGQTSEGAFDFLSNLKLEELDAEGRPYPHREFRLTRAEWDALTPAFMQVNSDLIPTLRAYQELDEETAPTRYISIDFTKMLRDESISGEIRGDYQVELDEITASLRQRRRSAVRALHQVNRRALHRLMAAIERPYRQRDLWEFYFQHAFRDVWPDPRNAYMMYAKALGIDDLTDEERAAIEALAIVYRSRHDGLTLRIADTIRDREEEGLTGKAPEWREKCDQLGQEIDDLKAERDKLNLEQWRSVEAILVTPERLAQLPPVRGG